MRLVGRITDWNDARGFGFVVPNGGVDRTFVHIKSFERKPRGRMDGLLVSYVQGTDGKGRMTADAVRLVDTRRHKPAASQSAGAGLRGVLALGCLVALGVGAAVGPIPALLVMAYVAMSAIALFAYGIDKSAAMNDRRRTPEDTLHLLALLGGWPGALYAQAAFRHKSRKTTFQIVFWLTVVANLAAVAWLVGSGHADTLNTAVLG